MTSIAWDGITLAADSQVTDDTFIDRLDCKKIRRISATVRGEKTIAYGLSGCMDAFYEIEEWIKGGCSAGEFPEDVEVTGILVTESHAYEFSGKSKGRFYEIGDFIALGSGTHFCLSAMHMGFSVVDAVKHAIKLDVYSGGKVRKITCR